MLKGRDLAVDTVWPPLLAAIAASGFAISAYRFGPLPVLAGTVAAGAFVVALLHPMVALYAAILLVPLERAQFDVGGLLTLTASKILFLVTAGAWVLRALAIGKSPLGARSALAAPFLLLLLPVTLGLAFADDRVAVLKVLGVWSILFLIYQMVVQEGDRHTVRNILFVTAIGAGITGLMTLISGGQEFYSQEAAEAVTRSVGPLGFGPNGTAGLLAMAMPAGLALGLQGPWLVRPVALVAAGLAFAGLIQTASRGGLVAAAGALAVMLLWPPFRRTAAAALAVLGLAVAIGSNPLTEVQAVDTTSHRVVTLLSSPSSNPRLDLWQGAVDQIVSNPVLGVGTGNFRVPSSLLRSDRTGAGTSPVRVPQHAHNILLTISAELGLLGLIALAWISVTLVRLLAKSCRTGPMESRALAFAVAAGLASVFAHGVVDYLWSKYVFAGLVVVLAGCAVVLAQDGQGRYRREPRVSPARTSEGPSYP